LIAISAFVDKAVADYVMFTTVVRAKQFDNKINAYISRHPRASVVNIGAGLDTTFYRVDNGSIQWYDLDLPTVIDIRRQLLPETDRTRCIAKSLIDPSWPQDIDKADGVLVIAGGVLMYFEESRVRQFFSLLADNFPGGEIVLDVAIKSVDLVGGAFAAGWGGRGAKQRDAMQAALIESFKHAWKIFPQNHKDKMLGALTTLSTPRSTDWTDVEAWWNALSTEEKDNAMHDFRTSMDVRGRWMVDDVNTLETWDTRITVKDQFPLFRGIPRDPSLSRSIRQFMDLTDSSGNLKIVHVRV